MRVSLSVGLLLTCNSPVLSFDRAACQAPTHNPLQGCPSNSILVGPKENITSIQDALLNIPHDTTPYTIIVLPGNYTEQVNVTRPGPLTLLGQTSHPNDASRNTVNVIWHNATGTASTGSYDNAYTSTLTVAPTLNSSLTGSGSTGNPVPADTPFGNQNFRVYNLNFINDYRPYAAGPSLAVSVSYANTGFYYTRFLSYQDTVYIGKLGNAYMYECIIGGQTDFIYGFGTLYITSSQILLRGCGGGITAWKGTNTTFANRYGVYIHSSSVQAANSTIAPSLSHRCALGRPWNSQMTSLFAHTYLDSSILPAGYIAWSTSEPRVNFHTTMAEYGNYGPGFNLTARRTAGENVTVEFTRREYERYATPEDVFQEPFTGALGNTAWIDRSPRA